ncbi:MAG: low molecular weight phosphotyrosine protein phosphatase [Azospirillum sp.]|nr:low molecular weight phosphotyrosine protein phosphatase [Azospirillum sp.]
MVRILFVCTGNICRSPTVEGVFRDVVTVAGLDGRIAADSAGTFGYHIGEPPDPRSVAAAAARGYDIAGQRARQVTRQDFDRFDLLLAMDRGHRRELLRLAPAGRQDRVGLFLDYAPELGFSEVPDPYYGGRDGFEQVLDLAEAGARGLLAALQGGLR